MRQERGFRSATVLDDRISDRQRTLVAARQAVDSVPEPLRGRMAGDLRNELTRANATLDQQVRGPLHAGTLHPADAWARLHAAELTGAALLSEAVQVVTGAVVRTTGDHDWPWRRSVSQFCAFSDALIDEVTARTPMSHWDSFSVPGVADAFGYPSRLISISVARPSIWTLATTGHELGHHAARTMHRFEAGRSHNVVDDLHAALDPPAGAWHWVEELFADAFAAWTLGPAYGLSCLTLAFDPLTARVGSATHPPDSSRLGVIAAVLAESAQGSEAWMADALRETWQDLLEASEAEPATHGVPVDPDQWTGAIVETLHEKLPFARYTTFPAAEALSAQLDTGAPAPQTSAVDVLNAAWLARVGATGAVAADEAHRNAVRLLQQILDRS